MTHDFAAAIRASLDLTTAQKLAEATRVIQETLAGRGAGPREGASEPQSMRRAIEHHVVDLTADSIEAESTTERAPRADARSPSWTPPGGTWTPPGATWAARPAGGIVETLRQSGLQQLNLNLNGLAVTKARKRIEIPEGAQFLSRNFTCAAGSRNYRLYIPRHTPDGRRALVIMLHGGTQDAEDFAAGTRMNDVAEENGFIVAYPTQPREANASLCWNWFRQEDQMRGRGEPSIIAGITGDVVTEHDIDPQAVFVAGLSAGGAMAAVMGATYPDLYAGIGVHSGLAYASAGDLPSAFAAMRGDAGPRGRRSPRAGGHGAARIRTIVFHGDADTVVHPSNAAKIVGPHGKDHVSVEHPRETGSAARYHTRTVTRDRTGLAVAQEWVIHGSGHAWSGGSPEGSYTDPAGPDASREMLRFFLEKRSEPGE
ncbi:MAG: extracellular catalytic domain type 1 short-chain-length polyhydroxyalkanoate depolymerase [Methyloceanibacter sp.]|uniref:extracellular catalytic domain type 1 short-chain-length polyhydroxyalkanoate depolymerase n=1 Tax=Methyloceanibacter sp. TaxID=1965321 RepID=UPI003D9B3B7A